MITTVRTVSVFCHCRYSVQSVLDAKSKLYAPKTLNLGCTGANNALEQKDSRLTGTTDCRLFIGPLAPSPVQNAVGIHVDLRNLPTNEKRKSIVHSLFIQSVQQQTTEKQSGKHSCAVKVTVSLHSSPLTGFSLLPLQAFSLLPLQAGGAARGWRQSAECRGQQRAERQSSESI